MAAQAFALRDILMEDAHPSVALEPDRYGRIGARQLPTEPEQSPWLAVQYLMPALIASRDTRRSTTQKVIAAIGDIDIRVLAEPGFELVRLGQRLPHAMAGRI